jgi:translocation and assembly module TamB
MRVGAAFGGRIGAPEVTGELTGKSLALRNLLQGVDVRDGDVAIALQGVTARIERFTARAGAGQISLQGQASLGENPRAELKMNAERFQLLGRVDRRIVTSGEVALDLARDAIKLDGELRVDEGLIDFTRSDAPTLSEDVQVRRSRSQESVELEEAMRAAEASSRARNIDMKLRVLLGDQLRLRGQGLDTGLRGDLLLSAPRGQLRVDGQVRTVSGTYNAYRQKLVIDRGVLTFNGPVQNAALDIVATRPNLDVRVGVAVTGTVLVPRVRLFSDPEMSDIDKLNWLVRGRPSDGRGGADSALLQAAALALLAGEDSSADLRLLGSLGLDEISVREGDTTSGAIVSVGKQLSSNWYIGYERSLNAAAGTWQLI